MPSGASGVTGFIRVRPEGRRVHPESLLSLGYALVVVGFILGRWVHWGAPLESSYSSGFAGFTGVCLGCCLAHAESLGSFAYALGVVVFIPVSMGSLGCSLGVVEFFCGR